MGVWVVGGVIHVDGDDVCKWNSLCVCVCAYMRSGWWMVDG